MAQTPEGKVKVEVKKILKEYGVWFFCPMQNGFGVVGIPDFICCLDGHFFAIETKAPKKLSNLTPNQIRVIEDIKNHNGSAIVVSDAELVREYIKEYRDEQRWSDKSGL
jgi:hypothetical protein